MRIEIESRRVGGRSVLSWCEALSVGCGCGLIIASVFSATMNKKVCVCLWFGVVSVV